MDMIAGSTCVDTRGANQWLTLYWAVTRPAEPARVRHQRCAPTRREIRRAGEGRAARATGSRVGAVAPGARRHPLSRLADPGGKALAPKAPPDGSEALGALDGPFPGTPQSCHLTGFW